MHAEDGAKQHQIQNDDAALRLPAGRLSYLKSLQIDALIYGWHSLGIIIAEGFTVIIFQGLLSAAAYIPRRRLSKYVKRRCQLPDPWTSAWSTTASCQLSLSPLHCY